MGGKGAIVLLLYCSNEQVNKTVRGKEPSIAIEYCSALNVMSCNADSRSVSVPANPSNGVAISREGMYLCLLVNGPSLLPTFRRSSFFVAIYLESFIPTRSKHSECRFSSGVGLGVDYGLCTTNNNAARFPRGI